MQVDNKEHKDFTVVTVSGESGFQRRQGFLLEIASALTGLGVSIHEAVIQVGLCPDWFLAA